MNSDKSQLNQSNQSNQSMDDKELKELIKEVQAVSSYTGASMKDSYDCYIRCNKDVVKAIIELEDGIQETPMYETVMVQSERLYDFVRDMIVKGNVSRIIIRRNGRVLLTIPVTMGAIGVVMFPYVSVIALLALMFGELEVVIEKNKINESNRETQQAIKKIKLAVDRV